MILKIFDKIIKKNLHYFNNNFSNNNNNNNSKILTILKILKNRLTVYYQKLKIVHKTNKISNNNRKNI